MTLLHGVNSSRVIVYNNGRSTYGVISLFFTCRGKWRREFLNVFFAISRGLY
jgi:hypothetical protein